MKRCLIPLLLGAALLLLCGCSGSAQTYTDYVQAVMDCTYRGETEAYCAMTGSTEAEALAIYEDEAEYVAQLICSQMAVKPEFLTEKSRDGYRELAKELMGSLRYTVNPVVPAGDHYQVTIMVEPTDLWDISIDDVEASYKRYYGERFGRVGIEYHSEVKLALVERNWGANVLWILRQHIGEAGGQTPVAAQFDIRTDAQGQYNIAAKDWMDVDDLLLDIAVNN